MKRILLLNCALLLMLGAGTLRAAEPQIVDYTVQPVFTVNPVKPNIMIILDNSGSMNFNAYGTYPGDGGIVADEPYQGDPYFPSVTVVTSRVQTGSDDAEEDGSGGSWASGSSDLDFGRFGAGGSQNSIVGVRFRSLNVPKGATIVNAWLEFTVNRLPTAALSEDDPILLRIQGQDIDDAPGFTGGFQDLSSRAKTKEKVFWGSNTSSSLDPWWPVNELKKTPNLKDIVQEIVDRDDWQSGNAMAFFLDYQASSATAKRDANSYEDDPGNPSLHPLLHIEYSATAPKRYYGYFNPDWFYSFGSSKFSHAYEKIGYNTDICPGSWEVTDTSGTSKPCLTDAEIVTNDLWDGNWANWAAMRRIDVARKVLMGGLATARTGGGNQTVYGETPDQTNRNFIKRFNSTLSAVSPYDGDYYYGLKAGYIYVDDDSNVFNGQLARCNVAIEKNETYEPEDFYEGNVAGVLQRVGDKAFWGNEFFYYGSGNNREGGYIASPIGTNMNTLITDLQNTGATTWTPLAESYYVAMQYFKQEDPASSLGYSNSAIGPTNNVNDPYYNENEFIPCSKSFVLMLTDGASTMDSQIPSSLKDADGDGDNTSCDEQHDTNCDYADGGSDFLDDVALWARTHDLRDDLDGDQNLILYAVYAFGNDLNARNLLKDAARNGGFIDRDGDNLPDGDYTSPAAERLEWDANDDAVPDTFFEAQDGYALEAQIMQAINDILRRAASGTAVSVLATSSEGEGNLVQAYFQPVLTTGLVETRWVGFLQSLWVDAKGNLREDTNLNKTLDLDADRIIHYELDAGGNTIVYKFNVSSGNEYPEIDPALNPDYVTRTMADIDPIWEAGDILADRDPDTRQIFTYLEDDPPVFTAFTVDGTTEDSVKPYLGVKDGTAWSYLGPTHAARTTNLINYVRGHDPGSLEIDPLTTDMRRRTVNNRTWRLGDIVHSTPVAVALPPENFGLIYSDQSYDEYYTAQKNHPKRETVVYVGGNDGMLHAFTSWQYDPDAKQFVDPDSGSGLGIGSELWAYIPNALLPQLKWLADPDYAHSYYVDLTPKVTDARIFDIDGDGDIDNNDDDATSRHLNGWGTILIGGMRFGGKDIPVTDDFDGDGTDDAPRIFSSSYFAIDVTNPRSPELMWERTYSGLGFTTSEPSVVKVGNQWYVVFGSGPTTYEGTSSQDAKVLIVDLKTGDLVTEFVTGETDAFMSGAASIDKNLNYNVDAIYIGESYQPNPTSWKGALYKVAVPWSCTELSVGACDHASYGMLGDYSGDCKACGYEDDPVSITNPWQLEKVFASLAPITAPPALSVDIFGNAWIYFGTGRYMSTNDKTDTTDQYLFGLKDPFFNPEHTSSGMYEDNYYGDYSTSLTLDTTTANPYSGTSSGAETNGQYLFDSDTYNVFFPWSCEAKPAGDCSSVPTGAVGDVNEDSSCTCDYDWPVYVCSSTDALTTDAVACGGVAGISLVGSYYVKADGGIFNSGLCQCLPYDRPLWGAEEAVSGSGACNDVQQGQLGDVKGDGSCTGYYWQAQGENDDSCLNVSIGDPTGTYAGPDGTTCTVTKMTSIPFAWNCTPRPAGDCSGVAPPDAGDMAGDGSTIASFWDCDPPVGSPADGCSGLDYTRTDSTYYETYDTAVSSDCKCTKSLDPASFVKDITTNGALSFDAMVVKARTYDGWMRTLEDPGERSVSKPALLGGISLFTSYVPSTATCSFGGSSYLYALYYETGTPYDKPVIGMETINGATRNKYRTSLGLGMASSVGIHVGKQSGNQATGFVQQSTGAIEAISLDPAFTIRSGLNSWKENDN